jgi:hypothetical protein
VVEVAAGTYPDQPIDSDASKTSASDVVLRPAAGATVRAGQVNIAAAKHLEIRDMQLAGWHTFNGTDDITFRNVTADDLYIDSSSNINILGGSYGPDTDYDNGQIRPACSGCPHSRNITIDGVYFHDAIITPGSGAHVECLQVWGTDYLTIRNSKFWNCEHHSVFIAGEGEPLSNITLENNWGGKVRSGYYSFRVTGSGPGEGCTNITYRDNSATTAIALTCLTASNVQLIGNVSPLSAGQCDSRYVWSYNVWDGAKCGAADLNAPSGFVNPSAFDLHLAPGSAAVNHGDPTSYPASDIDGQARPMGGMPDAGADESQ